jgi:hypothetical protein
MSNALSSRETALIHELIAAQQKASSDMLFYSVLIWVAFLIFGGILLSIAYPVVDKLVWWKYDVVVLSGAGTVLLATVTIPALAEWLAYKKVERIQVDWNRCMEEERQIRYAD